MPLSPAGSEIEHVFPVGTILIYISICPSPHPAHQLVQLAAHEGLAAHAYPVQGKKTTVLLTQDHLLLFPCPSVFLCLLLLPCPSVLLLSRPPLPTFCPSDCKTSGVPKYTSQELRKVSPALAVTLQSARFCRKHLPLTPPCWVSAPSHGAGNSLAQLWLPSDSLGQTRLVGSLH